MLSCYRGILLLSCGDSRLPKSPEAYEALCQDLSYCPIERFALVCEQDRDLTLLFASLPHVTNMCLPLSSKLGSLSVALLQLPPRVELLVLFSLYVEYWCDWKADDFAFVPLLLSRGVTVDFSDSGYMPQECKARIAPFRHHPLIKVQLCLPAAGVALSHGPLALLSNR